MSVTIFGNKCDLFFLLLHDLFPDNDSLENFSLTDYQLSSPSPSSSVASSETSSNNNISIITETTITTKTVTKIDNSIEQNKSSDASQIKETSVTDKSKEKSKSSPDHDDLESQLHDLEMNGHEMCLSDMEDCPPVELALGSLSLDEVVWRDVHEDPENNDPRKTLDHYAESFQMDL